MNKFISITLTASAFIFLAGCEDFESADQADKKNVTQQQKQYAIGQPVPQFDWSLERGLVIQLYEARNKEVATHTVWRSNTGKIEGDCPSVGFGLPYDTSLTNPLKSEYHSNGGTVTIEQPEPNGIFASKNSNATWVMCVIKQGDLVSTVPVYIESKVTVYPMTVNVSYDTDRVTFGTSKPSVTIINK